MNETSSQTSDFLDAAGKWFLATVDIRWVSVAAVIFIVLFWIALKLGKNRAMSREDAISLGQAVLNLYSAPVLFCLLVLSDPPVFDPAKKTLYQSAGFIASLFLAFGVVKQISTAWTEEDKCAQEKDKPAQGEDDGKAAPAGTEKTKQL